MSCSLETVTAVYAEPENQDTSCGCIVWGHYDKDRKPCHHHDKCVAHQLLDKLK